RINIKPTAKIKSDWDMLVIEASVDTPEHIEAMIYKANSNLIPVYLIKPAYKEYFSIKGHYSCIDIPFIQQNILQHFTTEKSHLPESKTRHKETPIKPIKIMVIEDNPINQQLVLEILEKSKHMVDLFDNANEALSRIKDNQYDLIISDYHLPGMNGIRFIQNVRNLNLAIPIIIMTADLTENVIIECKKNNIMNLLTKPFKPKELEDAIKLFVENNT
ncbi:MAG: response regulator, partial [Proteobacteria bacterium]|nr:response regulator [Pseudomonadota bacterium]